jgi:farnesyl-diphosphate farnesyltransferase
MSTSTKTLDTLTPDNRAYLRDALAKVSRSFALVVPWIEKPLNDYFAIAYLICRVVDNVEDCTEPITWRSDRYAELAAVIEEPAHATDVLHQWEQYRWAGLSSDERDLMTVPGGVPLWRIYGSLPAQPRRVISQWCMVMLTGMDANLYHLEANKHKTGIRLLQTEADYDDYCFVVAGTVGRMGTELIVDHFATTQSTADEMLAGSEACGRALQKTNILKDFLEDLERRVCFIPDSWLQAIGYAPLALAGAPQRWKQQVIENVLLELRQATDYLCNLPHELAGYRTASLLCLMPAYETIRNAALAKDVLYTQNHQIKISRSTIARLLVQAPAMATDNAAVRSYAQKLEQSILSEFDE